VDVTLSAQTVVATMHVTDDLSGAVAAFLEFDSPSSTQFHQFGLSLISGTALDGVWQGSIEIPEFSESGTWTLGGMFHVGFLQDAAGNVLSITKANLQAAGFPTNLTVISTPDVTPPRLSTIAFSSPSIDVSAGPQMITVTLGLTDSPAGVQYIFPTFQSPSGKQHQYITPDEFKVTSSGRAICSNGKPLGNAKRMSSVQYGDAAGHGADESLS